MAREPRPSPRAIRFLPVGPVLVAVLAVTVASACTGGDDGDAGDVDAEASMQVHSDTLPSRGRVPERFTCEGEDVAPDLSWGEAPDGTREVVVVVDDPDAPRGTFTHWTVWGLAPSDSLADGVPAGAVEGRNDFGSVGYRGPCPPPGAPHRYRFRVFAVDTPVGLETGATATRLHEAMASHVLAEGRREAMFGR